MSKFKVGDKVRITNYNIYPGYPNATVEKCPPDSVHYSIRLDEEHEGWETLLMRDGEIELVVAANPKTTYTPEQLEKARQAYWKGDSAKDGWVEALKVFGLYPEEPQRTLPKEDGVILWFPNAKRVATFHALPRYSYWSVDADEVAYNSASDVTDAYGDDWVVLGIGDDFVNPEVTK